MQIELRGVPEAKAQIAQRFAGMRVRINAAAFEAMADAIVTLRQRVVDAMYAAGIRRGSGGTEEAIQTGNGKPFVYGNEETGRITGVVTTVKASEAGKDARMPMGAWLGAGTFNPAIANKMMVFTAPDGTVVFTRKRAAYQVPGRPFLNPAVDSFMAEFRQIVQERLSAAVATE